MKNLRYLYVTLNKDFMKILTPLLLSALCLLLASCSSSKTTLPYFVDLQSQPTGELPVLEYMPTIQPDDELMITLTSKSPAATEEFNVPFVNPAKSDLLAQSTTPRMQTYRVDSEGDILFPVFGKIHVAGMTTEGLRDYLTGRISATVTDPIVSVSLLSFDVTVAGEVNTPTTVHIAGQRLTLIDAIAQAGDMTPYGERSNVLIIREVNGKREYAHVDLNSSDVLTSPYFYLRPKDYVYVSPNKVRQANSKYNQDNAFKLSVISTVVSATSVIASLVIALAVK